MIVKKIHINGLSEEENVLEKIWGMHREAKLKFNKLLKEVDEGKHKLEDITKPKTGFIDLKAKLLKKYIRKLSFLRKKMPCESERGKKGFL